MHRRIIPRGEDMAFQGAEADGSSAFEAHPVVGENVVRDEGGPDGCATGGVSCLYSGGDGGGDQTFSVGRW